MGVAYPFDLIYQRLNVVGSSNISGNAATGPLIQADRVSQVKSDYFNKETRLSKR